MSELSTPYFYYVEDEYINFLKKKEIEKEILPECLMYIIGILKICFWRCAGNK